MTPTGRDPGQVGRNQRCRDAVLVPVPDQVIRVVEFECETEHGGDRCQRNVALVPVEPDADDSLTFPFALAHDAAVNQRCRVGAGLWRGQCETGNFGACGEPGQVTFLLFVGSVMQQQFGRAERVRHADSRGRRGAAARELHDDAGVGIGRKFEAAVLLRDDHREKLVLDDVVPHVFRHVGELVADLPVVEHPAQFFAWTVEEGLLFLRQLRRRIRHQPLPVRHAGEQLTVPPNAAGFERFALGIRHLGQHLAVDVQQRFGDLLASKLDQVWHDHGAESGPQKQLPKDGAVAEDCVREDGEARSDGRAAQVDASICQEDAATHEEQQPEKTDNEAGQALLPLIQYLAVRRNTIIAALCAPSSTSRHSNDSIAARSSRNSASVASMRERLNSSISSPCTIS